MDAQERARYQLAAAHISNFVLRVFYLKLGGSYAEFDEIKKIYRSEKPATGRRDQTRTTGDEAKESME